MRRAKQNDDDIINDLAVRRLPWTHHRALMGQRTLQELSTNAFRVGTREADDADSASTRRGRNRNNRIVRRNDFLKTLAHGYAGCGCLRGRRGVPGSLSFQYFRMTHCCAIPITFPVSQYNVKPDAL